MPVNDVVTSQISLGVGRSDMMKERGAVRASLQIDGKVPKLWINNIPLPACPVTSRVDSYSFMLLHYFGTIIICRLEEQHKHPEVLSLLAKQSTSICKRRRLSSGGQGPVALFLLPSISFLSSPLFPPSTHPSVHPYDHPKCLLIPALALFYLQSANANTPSAASRQRQ